MGGGAGDFAEEGKVVTGEEQVADVQAAAQVAAEAVRGAD
jgi:hypothetical protein